MVVPNASLLQTKAPWEKGKGSYAFGNCVEVAALVDGGVAIRDSKDPTGPAIVMSGANFRCFVADTRGNR